MLDVKYAGFGGYMEVPCYEDGNGKLYFDENNGTGGLNLYTGAYRDEFGDILGEPDKKVEEEVRCAEPFARHLRGNDYQMLGRLKQDCEYFLGAGAGNEDVLYYKNVTSHCDAMEKLWGSFSEADKPEWISMEQINEYRTRMTEALEIKAENSFAECVDGLAAALDESNRVIAASQGHERNASAIYRQRIFIDMDGTLAEFRNVDTLEKLYEPGYFLNLQPNSNVVNAVKLLIEKADVEVYVLSAYLTDSAYALDEKNEWLDRYLPELKKENRIFMPCGKEKTSAVPGHIREDDFLLDDYTKNLGEWEPPARGIKLINDINHTHGTWEGDRIRFTHEPEILCGMILDVMKNRTRYHEERLADALNVTESVTDEQTEEAENEMPDEGFYEDYGTYSPRL